MNLNEIEVKRFIENLNGFDQHELFVTFIMFNDSYWTELLQMLSIQKQASIIRTIQEFDDYNTPHWFNIKYKDHPGIFEQVSQRARKFISLQKAAKNSA